MPSSILDVLSEARGRAGYSSRLQGSRPKVYRDVLWSILVRPMSLVYSSCNLEDGLYKHLVVNRPILSVSVNASDENFGRGSASSLI